MNQKETIWSTVLRVLITILTAIATSLGVQSCIASSDSPKGGEKQTLSFCSSAIGESLRIADHV